MPTRGRKGSPGSLRGAATLHVIEGGDHSFKVLKRSGRDQGEVDREVLDTCLAWIRQLARGRDG